MFINAPIGSKSIKRWYRVSESGGISYSSCDLTLYYSDVELSLSGLSENNLTLRKYENGNWIDKGGTVNASGNFVELTGVSQSELSGDWAFADANDSSLPVELISFVAKGGDTNVTLQWTTASELENQGFIIQRSNQKEKGYYEIESYLDNNELKRRW